MYVLIVSTVVAYNSLFSSSLAVSQYSIQGLTLEQCKALGEKEKHEEKMNTTFSKSLIEKSYKCVNIKEVK